VDEDQSPENYGGEALGLLGELVKFYSKIKVFWDFSIERTKVPTRKKKNQVVHFKRFI